MRGTVYRLGRRRAGSILLAMGMAGALTLGSGSAALAKRPAADRFVGATHSHAVIGRVYDAVRLPANTLTSAHTAGHKIA
jgi:hypothetical protein